MYTDEQVAIYETKLRSPERDALIDAMNAKPIHIWIVSKHFASHLYRGKYQFLLRRRSCMSNSDKAKALLSGLRKLNGVI